MSTSDCGAPHALALVRQLHDEWGSTDAEDVDQLALWERLDHILRSADADL